MSFFTLFKRHKSHNYLSNKKDKMLLVLQHAACCVALLCGICKLNKRIKESLDYSRCVGESISVNQLIMARVTCILAIGGLCVGVCLGK